MRVLVTGGAGFMGSQLVRELVEAGHDVVVLDKFTYAGHRAHLVGVPHHLVLGDVCHADVVATALVDCDAVMHLAAESHVERALTDGQRFLKTNVLGTHTVLSAAAQLGVERFVHMSTDEVFGAAVAGVFHGVEAPMRPGNAYAASKVGAEALVYAWRHTHGYPASIVRCTNNYGPRQHPEKAVPCWTLAALGGGPIPVHGPGRAVRDWLYVADWARGMRAILERGDRGKTWHLAGQSPLRNEEMALRCGARCGVDALAHGPERQGQDLRYALDDEDTRRELGWAPQVSLDEGLDRTVEWYRSHGDLWG